MPETINLDPVTAPLLTQKGVCHGFFTRQGGVSDSVYESLNVGLGSQDSRENVLENRRRATAWLGHPPEALATLFQCHSADVVTVKNLPEGTGRKADAMVTDRPGIILGILTADCGPLLLADRQAGVIGAAHAGWKGALNGIVERTVEKMISLGARPDKIDAALGPTISGENYEVGDEFFRLFVENNEEHEQYFRKSTNAGRHMFDLPGFIICRLADTGVRAWWTGMCTYEDDELFFSYRRACHNRQADYGRQLSAILLETT